MHCIYAYTQNDILIVQKNCLFFESKDNDTCAVVNFILKLKDGANSEKSNVD